MDTSIGRLVVGHLRILKHNQTLILTRAHIQTSRRATVVLMGHPGCNRIRSFNARLLHGLQGEISNGLLFISLLLTFTLFKFLTLHFCTFKGAHCEHTCAAGVKPTTPGGPGKPPMGGGAGRAWPDSRCMSAALASAVMRMPPPSPARVGTGFKVQSGQML